MWKKGEPPKRYPLDEKTRLDVEIGTSKNDSSAFKIVVRANDPYVVVYALQRHPDDPSLWRIDPDAGVVLRQDQIDDVVDALSASKLLMRR